MMRTAPDEAERLRLLTERAAADVTLFARHGLGHHLRLPFAPFHHTLFRWHRRMEASPLPGREGLRFVLAAPRGSAKSTMVSLVLALHDIVYARERYIILVSATQRQARQRLAAIRRELCCDTPLARWFHPRFGRTNVNGSAGVLTAGSVRVEAFGGGSEMRGISWESWRPTKIILDDAESSAAALSPRRRRKLHDWFGEVIEHLGDTYTHILVIGTVLHRESLLSTLLGRPDFESLLCRSIEEDAAPSALWDEWHGLLTGPGERNRTRARSFFLAHRESMEAGNRVLWREHEDYEQLRAQRVLQGRRAFSQEKQNDPAGPEGALFDPATAWIARRDGAEWIVQPPSGSGRERRYAESSLRRFGYHDAALGKGRAQGKGDYAALATIAAAPDGMLILTAVWVRRATPTQQVEAMFAAHEDAPFEQLALEGTGFQEVLALLVEEERVRRAGTGLRTDLPLVVVKPHLKKEARIARLEPLLSSGRLALAEGLPEEFHRELADYPAVTHDDALDAAAGAADAAQKALSSAPNRDVARVPKKRHGAAGF